MNWFGFHLIRVISGPHPFRVNKILSQFGLSSGHFRFRVNTASGWFNVMFQSNSVQCFRMLVQVWFRVIQFGSILPNLRTVITADFHNFGDS